MSTFLVHIYTKIWNFEKEAFMIIKLLLMPASIGVIWLEVGINYFWERAVFISNTKHSWIRQHTFLSHLLSLELQKWPD